MLDELQNRLAFLEKRLTVLEHEVSSLKAARQELPRRASLMLPHRVPCDATGLLIANGYDLDPNDRDGKWRWVGNDGPIQFVLPFGLGEKATARIVLAGHPKVDLQFLRVYVNDKPVSHSLEPDVADRLALLVPLEPSPQTIDIVLDRIKSISLKESGDARPLAFKFFGMEIVARSSAAPEIALSRHESQAVEPQAVEPSIRFGDIRLDERFAGTGDYRHLDISIFDTRLEGSHWDRIKFKFANFKGDTYLEFRSRANWPEVFRAWPGTDEDEIGKLLKIPEPKTAKIPELADRGDLELLKALFENLDLIVRTVTTGIDAPNREIELWREEATALADRALKILASEPGATESRPPPAPVAPPPPPKPKSEPEAVDNSFRFGRLRLDERLPQSGEYRHLDISIFDARQRDNRWGRIKFKFASFRGANYLEFRSHVGWPEVFRVWPGAEEDGISKLLKIPDPKTGDFPEFVDPRDRDAVRALFENLEPIVRTVTTGIDAPASEIELWREEARALADRARPRPAAEVVEDSIRFGNIRLDERLPQTGEYRHLDVSIFDVRLKEDHWERIKFKFASFQGRNYLEFRDLPDRPRVFRVWPGTEEDGISKLLNVPDPKTATVPELGDVRDRDILKALFENLDLIVRTVTTGIDAPNREIELWREEATALADRALKILASEPGATESRPPPAPVAPPPPPKPKSEPEAVDNSFRFGRLRLDERLPQSGEYRHLDISIFDARQRDNRWGRIKFKFASFRGANYLEFRSHVGWPEVFRVWPGAEEDGISKLLKIPDPKTGDFPEFVDPRDRDAVRALFENLEPIVRTVTTGIDAPASEIELWREEARALADRARPRPAAEVVEDSIRFGNIRLDERLPQTGEYRHLDVSIFDVRLKEDHWERIKFKFASFQGRNYLEFRDLPDRPRVFRVWPGTEEDGISKLLNVPEPKTATVPELGDVRDRDILKALFENLDLIVRTVTTGIDAPEDEIALWREEARILAGDALRAMAAP